MRVFIAGRTMPRKGRSTIRPLSIIGMGCLAGYTPIRRSRETPFLSQVGWLLIFETSQAKALESYETLEGDSRMAKRITKTSKTTTAKAAQERQEARPQAYGYARVSTTDQDLSLQEAALEAAGCTVIRSEKRTGTSRNGRTELETLLAFLRPGDSLVVTRIDRLARSLRDLQNLVHELREKGAHLKATEQPIDTSTAAGKAFLDMLGVFAEFETNLRRERQMEGIVAAKAKGVYKGRPRSISAEEVKRLLKEGVGASEVAKRLGIGRASVYRVAGEG